MKSVTLAELAALVEGTVSGDTQLKVSSVNSLELAEPGELSFINSSKKADLLTDCSASAFIVPLDFPDSGQSLIRVNNPDLAEAVIHNYLLAEDFQATGIHKQAVVGQDCDISDRVSIAGLVSIGDRVRIGEEVTLHPGVVVGDDVTIGAGSVLHANVVVARGCSLGREVVLYHGAVIGSDGFGFATDTTTGSHVSKPQVGTVALGDGVQIGANSCVDRAAFGVTKIKAGVRIDNLVMVGHNCVIGENSILVGQAGIAGSTTLGRNVVLAARAGLAGHLQIEDGVVVAAMAGVHNNQKKGAIVGGIPAFDVRKWGRATAAFTRLPDMVREVRRLRKELDQLLAGQEKGKK